MSASFECKVTNSKENTLVILCFKASDYHSNLERALKPLRPQIEKVRNMRWKDKRVGLFYFSDYKHLTDTYGLPGAKGIYFCVWCFTTVSDIHEHFYEQEAVRSRKLPSIREYYKGFHREAKGDKNVARKYHNVIHKPLLTIPISHVVPPYMYILLGVVKRHHDLLTDACHIIDLAIAKTIYVVEDSLFSKNC